MQAFTNALNIAAQAICEYNAALDEKPPILEWGEILEYARKYDENIYHALLSARLAEVVRKKNRKYGVIGLAVESSFDCAAWLFKHRIEEMLLEMTGREWRLRIQEIKQNGQAESITALGD